MTTVYLDEVGRGCLFGPVVTCALIWDDNAPEPPFNVASWDSKKLSPKKRNQLEEYIKEHAIEYTFGSCNASEIDEMNILNATHIAFHRALDSLKTGFQFINVDGNSFRPYIKDDEFIPYNCVIQGDTVLRQIGMSSILAKNNRDRLVHTMCDADESLDNKYALRTNKGYGTLRHREGIKTHGYHKEHRKTFQVR